MLKIIIDDKIPFIRGAFESVKVNALYVSGSEITPELLRDADALIVRTRTLCNEHLLGDSSVKMIATATIGYDHIDTHFCARNGIAWKNAPGCNAMSVQQYVASVLCEFAAKRHFDLRGKVLGIVGCGNTGSAVRKFAQTIGMKTLVCDPPRARAEGCDKINFLPLEDVLREADIITCHVPLSDTGIDATENMMNAHTFALMKKDVCFINASRGEIVNEIDLFAALQSQKIAECALDVWRNEPHIAPNLLEVVSLATPHIAGYSADGKFNGTQMAVRAVSEFFNLHLNTWSPPPLAQPENFYIDTYQCINFQERLREAVQGSYSVNYDDCLLREAPSKFEHLRGNYRFRREFKAFSVHNVPFEEREIFEAIGFQCPKD